EAGVQRLEARLLSDGAARRHFAEYFQHHTEIHFAVRAGRAADAVLGQLASRAPLEREELPGRRGIRRAWSGRWARAAAGVALAATALALAWIGWPGHGPRSGPAIDGKSPGANVAWLVNAQDCRWTQRGQGPGRD